MSGDNAKKRKRKTQEKVSFRLAFNPDEYQDVINTLSEPVKHFV